MKRKNYSNYAVVVIALLLATTVNAVPAEMEKKNLMEFVTKGVAKCKESAEAGDAEGQVLYGRALARGWGVEKDEAKAIEWYRKSAEQGNASGQCYLGMCFVNGIGCETDTTNGVKWLRKAALQGLPSAQTYLGLILDIEANELQMKSLNSLLDKPLRELGNGSGIPIPKQLNGSVWPLNKEML